MTLKQQIQLLNTQAAMIKNLREELVAELASLERAAGELGIRLCEHPECCEPALRVSCDGCDARFCAEHGHPGGDQHTGYGLIAEPATCWKCREAANA